MREQSVRRPALLIACVAFGTWLAAACANAIAPTGGPPDELAPELLRVTPQNGDTSVRPKVITLQFDEVINEAPKGATSLAELFLISPRSGDVQVDWKRSRLEIKAKDGFRDSTVYTVIMRPGLQDLRNNSIDTATTLVFSTRGPIPNTTIAGVVFDWPAGKGARAALVEAISVVDTTLAYIGVADTAGRFALRYVPPGQYIVRGFLDRNGNRALERTELWDTVRIPLRDSANVELYSFIHDTLPVRISEIAIQDSGRRLRLTFDKPLAIGQAFTPPQFSLRTMPDSAPAAQRVVIVRTKEEQLVLDSLSRKQKADSAAAERAARDTIKPDSAALARADSVARARRRDSLAAAEIAQREARRLLTLRGGRPITPVDTTPPPKMSRPVPTSEMLVVLDAPLAPNTRYLLETRDLQSLSGVRGSATRTILTPKADPVPPRDSTPPRDTTVRRVTTPPDTVPRR